MNEELFNFMKKLALIKNRIIKRKSENKNDVVEFDNEVIMLKELKNIGYLDINEKNIKKNTRDNNGEYLFAGQYKFTYNGKCLLRFNSYIDYNNSINKNSLNEKINKTININNSNVAIDSQNFTQNYNSNINDLIKILLDEISNSKKLNANEQIEFSNELNQIKNELVKQQPDKNFLKKTIYYLNNSIIPKYADYATIITTWNAIELIVKQFIGQ